MLNKTNILLIEDSKSDQKLICKYLDEAGIRYNILTADSIADGIELLSNSVIDIVLLDLGLPDSQGFKSIQKILDKANLKPVIVLTGTHNTIIETQSIKAGAQDYLIKDKLTPFLLEKTIQNSLLRSQSLSKLQESNFELKKVIKENDEAMILAHLGFWDMDIVNYNMNWSRNIYNIFMFQPNSTTPTLSLYLDYVHVDDKDAVRDFFDDITRAGEAKKIMHRIVINGSMVKYVALSARLNMNDPSNHLKLIGSLQDITNDVWGNKTQKNLEGSAYSKIIMRALQDINFKIKTPINSLGHLSYLLNQTPLRAQQFEILVQIINSTDELNKLTMELNGMLNCFKDDCKNTIQQLTWQECQSRLSGSLKDFTLYPSGNTSINKNSDLYNISLPLDLICFSAKCLQVHINQKFTSQKVYTFEIVEENRRASYSLALKVEMENSEDFNLLKSELQAKQERNPDIMMYLNSWQDGDENLVKIFNHSIALTKGTFKFEKTNDVQTLVIKYPCKVVQKIQNTAISKPDYSLPLKILIVDDHFVNRLSTKKSIQSWFQNTNIKEGENGEEAVSLAATFTPDVILMDIQMPIMNGLEATRIIKKSNKSMIIIGMTASLDQNQDMLSSEAGFDDFIRKPFKPEELKEKLEKHLSSVFFYYG
jgi:CheY-like chemotaxis protein